MTKPAAWASERSTLENELANLRQSLAEQGFPDPSHARAQDTEGLASISLDLYDELEHALKKMDAGTYGACEGCSKPISKERLQAMPAARYCFGCAVKAESDAAASADDVTGEHQVEDKTELGIPAFGHDDMEDDEDAHTVQTDVSRLRGEDGE